MKIFMEKNLLLKYNKRYSFLLNSDRHSQNPLIIKISWSYNISTYYHKSLIICIVSKYYKSSSSESSAALLLSNLTVLVDLGICWFNDSNNWISSFSDIFVFTWPVWAILQIMFSTIAPFSGLLNLIVFTVKTKYIYNNYYFMVWLV